MDNFNFLKLSKVQQLMALVVKKDEKLKSTAIELERTQNTLHLLNDEMSRLDHLITSSKFFGDHSGVDYKGELLVLKLC